MLDYSEKAWQGKTLRLICPTLTPVVNVIKPFFFTKEDSKLGRAFFLGKPFQPSPLGYTLGMVLIKLLTTFQGWGFNN